MIQICFIARQNFGKKVAQLRKYQYFIRNICLSWHKSLFLNFQKFKKFENEKNCPEIMLFYFSSLQLLTVSKAVDVKIRKTSWFYTIRKSLIHKKKN